MYSSTQLILDLAIKTAVIGVRHGSPTSCFLYTLHMYVNDIIRQLKIGCDQDGFLGQLHCLMLMDDSLAGHFLVLPVDKNST